MKRIFVYVCKYACIRRFLDAYRICTYFSKNGHEVVTKPSDAEIIIFVTCAVTRNKAKISSDKIKEFQRKYDAELIVAGCLQAIEPKRLSEIFDGKTIVTKDLDKIDELFPENKIKFSSINDANIKFQNVNKEKPIGALKKFFGRVQWIENISIKLSHHVLKNLFGEHSFLYEMITQNPFYNKIYNIRVSWGCMGNCSYCAIKKAIGPFHSKPLDQCIKEFKKGLHEGYQHFIIAADDTGTYGLDIGSNLPELLDELTKIPGEYKISIQSISPMWVIKYIDELEEILKRQKIVSLQSPIESGSSRILKLMHRYSDVEKMKDVFLRLRKSSPDIEVNTQYVLGFPTEAEEDFKQTLDFIKEIDFSLGQILPFSCRPDTEAEKIEPKITKKEIIRRFKYAKKFLKKAGYSMIYSTISTTFVFYKKSNK